MLSKPLKMRNIDETRDMFLTSRITQITMNNRRPKKKREQRSFTFPSFKENLNCSSFSLNGFRCRYFKSPNFLVECGKFSTLSARKSLWTIKWNWREEERRGKSSTGLKSAMQQLFHLKTISKTKLRSSLKVTSIRTLLLKLQFLWKALMSTANVKRRQKTNIDETFIKTLIALSYLHIRFHCITILSAQLNQSQAEQIAHEALYMEIPQLLCLHKWQVSTGWKSLTRAALELKVYEFAFVSFHTSSRKE